MRWHVYVLQCVDGTLYTGMATDVQRRFDRHNSGRGAKYTRGRRPVFLQAVSSPMSRREAARLERAVKKLSKDQKVQKVREC